MARYEEIGGASGVGTFAFEVWAATDSPTGPVPDPNPVERGGIVVPPQDENRVDLTVSERRTGYGDNGDIEGWHVEGRILGNQPLDVTAWCETST